MGRYAYTQESTVFSILQLETWRIHYSAIVRKVYRQWCGRISFGEEIDGDGLKGRKEMEKKETDH
jgi:hypothetical protein